MTLIDDVRAVVALRRKATPGPWRHGPLFWEGWTNSDDGGLRVFEVPHVYPDIGRDREPDAAYIVAAANLDWDALAAVVDLGANIEALLADLVRGPYLASLMEDYRAGRTDAERVAAWLTGDLRALTAKLREQP